MDKKTIKRMLYGIVALAFLLIAGREFAVAGVSLESVVAGGAGLCLGFMAVTGMG